MNREMGPEIRERSPQRGRYSIPVVRMMAGVESENLGKRSLGDDIARYKEQLRKPTIITTDDGKAEIITGLPNEHVVEASRSERPKKSSVEIDAANQEWAQETAKWVRNTSEDVDKLLLSIFDIDRGTRQPNGEWDVSLEELADQLNGLRADLFDGEDYVSGDLNVDVLVNKLCYGNQADDGTGWDDWKVISPDVLEHQLEVVNSFLYAFGKKKTVELVKDRALAQSKLEEIRHASDSEKEALLREAEVALERELPEQETGYYVPTRLSSVEGESLLATNSADTPGKFGSADVTLGRRGELDSVSSTAGAPGDGGKPGGGEGGVHKETEQREVLHSMGEWRVALLDHYLPHEQYRELRDFQERRTSQFPELVVEGDVQAQKGWGVNPDVRIIDINQVPEEERDKIDQIVRYSRKEDVNGKEEVVKHSVYLHKTASGEIVPVEILGAEYEGSAFSTKGNYIKKVMPDGSVVQEWWQPLIYQKKESVRFMDNKTGKVVEAESAGFVGIMIDSKGRVALAMEQEPGADTPKKALFRTPFQGNRAKIERILKKDPAFENDSMTPVLRALVPEGKTLDDLLLEGFFDVLPAPEVDANRLTSGNLGVVLHMPDDVVSQLEASGKVYMASLDEIKRLNKAGFLNLHAGGGILQNLDDIDIAA